MNKVIFIGNLTHDPELTETPNGVSVCRFGLAVQRPYANGDGERQADFFECTAWRGLGETIAQYCKKGKKIAITGSIQLRNYEDNKGVKRTAVDIIVQDCEFLSPKDNDEAPAANIPPVQGRINTAGKKPTMQPMDDTEDDIPF